MSADQLASSFGDPNAQPPTPKRTPTFAILPSPVFETPKKNQGRFDESGGWTPRFAEEYSVFNATPGNLRGSRDPFPDFGPATPYSVGVGQERPLSAERTPANKLSPNQSLPFSLVESSEVVRSLPAPLQTPTFDRSAAVDQLPGSVGRRVKARGTAALGSQGQTVTPPPTARKGDRKLAPKLDTAAMQNDQDFVQQPHYMATTQQQAIGNFVTAQGDMFGYPLSAPASAPAFGAQRSFWDPDPNLAGMDIDFGANGGDVFQPPTPQQPPGPEDWQRVNQMLQDQSGIAGHGDGHVSSGDHQPSLVSQAPVPMLVTSSTEHQMFAVSYPTAIDDPFRMGDNGGAVNPGLLFSRPQSASMDTASFNQPMQAPSSSGPMTSQDGPTDSRVPSIPNAAGPSESRRSVSVKDVTPRKQDRSLASSPIKATGRPGLSRSFSESKGRKTIGRSSLPTLAPAPRPQSQLVNNAGVSANRPIVSQPQRPSGRVSPSKGTNNRHHHRLSSLSSIPETSGPQMRTQAKFTIDANGRARVETTVVVVDEPPSSARKRHSSYTVARRHQWDSSDDDDSSSTDDEPIIIPSRNTSFALPDPRKPTTIHPFHNSQRSVSEHSTTSYTSFQGGSQNDADSDGETVVNDLTPTRKASGDAASELRKVRESRQRQWSASKQKRLSSSASGTTGFTGNYAGQPATSPTTLSETSLPTPTSDSRSRGVRCICNRAEAGRNDFLVQCESCEMWVHGHCVNITQRDMPSIYICAFCANTPNMRGGRLRDNGRISGAVGPPGSVTSPLAHKSFKSFR
ncbi:hypothetical protein MFIFM68171_10776 [Madurella fahalii]|uniref:PHD-type domain-containing protein n=1 Tax=Madurella fahalii TaxID=1157608 RepID=A0ABQ0GS49_9PEZI